VETENTAGPEQTALRTPVATPITPRDSQQDEAPVETGLPAATVVSDVAATPEPEPDADRSGPSPQVADAPAVPTASEAAALPRPARKPATILALADRMPEPESPTSLDAGPDLALAVAEPEPPAVEAPPEPDPYASVPMLWQLPSSIRSKLPKLSLTVHVYAPEPSGRFVIVDRRKYREGEALAGGVKLEAIVPDGVILVSQGQLYKLGN
jgi:general secretion pathway protein B